MAVEGAAWQFCDKTNSDSSFAPAALISPLAVCFAVIGSVDCNTALYSLATQLVTPHTQLVMLCSCVTLGVDQSCCQQPSSEAV